MSNGPTQPGPTKESVLEALKALKAPSDDRDVVTLKLVANVAVNERVAHIAYALPAAAAQLQEQFRQITTAAIMRMPGIAGVEVTFAIKPPGQPTNSLPGVKYVVAVGAGKGGVGKSTVAAILAVGLQRQGLRVGLLDADVYGPSLPKIMGMEGMAPSGMPDGRIVPPEIEGIKCMSMGFLISPDEAVVWRGPMAQKYVKEFIERGFWGELDYLIVDLPPGTGDIPLTLAQSIPLSGAVVVCTPQEVALLDAVKALRMYQKLNVDILGVVENMSYYICPHCGNRDDIFSTGGAANAARELEVPFLGAIPLNVAIRINGDKGAPLSNFTRTEPSVASALDNFVKRTAQEVEERARKRMPLPQLNIS